jgi:hypothetical protein
MTYQLRDLNGKVVIITGATAGIGAAAARALVEKGCKVVLNARSEERLKGMVAELGANAISGFTTTSNVATSLDGYANVDAARALSRKTNGKIGVGIRAFIGAEYFILPKISIGGEFGWGIGYQLNTKDKSTWDAEGTSTAAGSTQIGKEIKVKDSVNGGSNFILDTDRNASNSNTYNLMGGSGTIRLTFHF